MVVPDAVGWLMAWVVTWVAVVKIEELLCNFPSKNLFQLGEF
jgi:hypothetical protein